MHSKKERRLWVRKISKLAQQENGFFLVKMWCNANKNMAENSRRAALNAKNKCDFFVHRDFMCAFLRRALRSDEQIGREVFLLTEERFGKAAG